MLSILKSGLWALGCWPLLLLVVQAGRAELGPDPGETIVLTTGLWALRLLLLTLVLRPLRDITGRQEFVRARRLVGLFSWFYASLHLAAATFYIVGWRWADIALALRERTYIVLGLFAWLLLLPLAITSTRAAQRRLGRLWRQLHRLIYPAALLACLHFIWLVRSDYFEPAFYSLLLALLMAWRVYFSLRHRRGKR